MTRTANHKAKTLRVTLIPREDQEIKIRAFKELCARNNLSMSNILFEKIEDFLREHNWPPGNSQTQLIRFGAEPTLVCFRCQKTFPHLRRVEYVSGEVQGSCEDCIKADKLKHVIKKVKEVV